MVTRIGPKRPVKLYLAEWRKYRGLTQQQLADRLDTTKGTISRWESGDRDMNTDILAALADALGCEEVRDLFRPPNQPSADDLMRGMNAAQRRQALRVIEALKTGTSEG